MISFSFHPLKRMEEEIICNRWKDLADDTKTWPKISQVSVIRNPGLYGHCLTDNGSDRPSNFFFSNRYLREFTLRLEKRNYLGTGWLLQEITGFLGNY